MSKDRLSAIGTSVRDSRYDGHKFENHGLMGRRLGPGRYRFRQVSGKPWGRILGVGITLLEPWAGESVLCAVTACERHGRSCPLYDDDGDCRLVRVLAESSRWQPLVSLDVDGIFEVSMFRHPRVRTLEGARRGRVVCRDAGFVVQAIMGAP